MRFYKDKGPLSSSFLTTNLLTVHNILKKLIYIFTYDTSDSTEEKVDSRVRNVGTYLE